MSNTLFIWLKRRAQRKWGRQRRVWLMPAVNTVFSRHLFQISASHAFNLLLIKTGPTHLSSFDHSISVKARQQKKEKKRRAHTCDWPAGERLVFQLAVIRDWLQEEQVLIAFFERAVRFRGRETKSHVKNKTKTKTKNVEREESRELHFHLSGEGEVNRFVLEERKKKNAKQTDVSRQYWSLARIWWIIFFFFALLRGYRVIDKGIPDFSLNLLLQARSVDGDSGRAL